MEDYSVFADCAFLFAFYCSLLFSAGNLRFFQKLGSKILKFSFCSLKLVQIQMSFGFYYLLLFTVFVTIYICFGYASSAPNSR